MASLQIRYLGETAFPSKENVNNIQFLYRAVLNAKERYATVFATKAQQLPKKSIELISIGVLCLMENQPSDFFNLKNNVITVNSTLEYKSKDYIVLLKC